jgi:hypothetical protein
MTVWGTVIIGGIILAENVLELGGVVPDARQLTAGFLAVLVLLHGLTLAWERGKVDDAAGLRLPRWPLYALPLLLWLGYGWWTDTQAPWASRDTFFLAAQAWLLCWVVAATPGGRVISWAWLIVVAVVAAGAYVMAVGWQRGDNSLWLPLGRELPETWAGRWTGTLPTPGAFGGLMVLAGAPALVMALSRRLGFPWRIGLLYLGAMLMYGALRSDSLGAWLGLGCVLGLLPLVVGMTANQRVAGWAALALAMAGYGFFFLVFRRYGADAMGVFSEVQGGEPSLAGAQAALALAWQKSAWLGSHGKPYPELSLAAGVTGAGDGVSYGFSDWMDLATTWGLLGLGLGLAALGGLLAAAWTSWAKLPFLVLPSGTTPNTSQRRVRKHSPSTPSYTPETKIMLGAGALSLTAFALAMLGARMLNIPALAYSFAVMAGVVARNIPQRGGSLRLEPMTRWIAGMVPALLVAVWLVWVVAPVSLAEYKLGQATHWLEAATQRPGVLKENPGLIGTADEELRQADGADPNNAQIWIETAWLHLEQSLMDPAEFDTFSRQAEEAASRAVMLAPDAPGARVTLGLAYLINNRLGDAQGQMRQALDLAPNDPYVQYYAVATLALDPASRAMAKDMVEAMRDRGYPPEHLKRLDEVYTWGVMAKVPLQGLRQRPLPPRYVPPPPWPALEGLPHGTAATTAAPATASGIKAAAKAGKEAAPGTGGKTKPVPATPPPPESSLP